MNVFYEKANPKQKISRSVKKNAIQEIKSNHIIYDRNPLYMNYQADIFYTPESSLNLYNSYSDDFFNYDYYNYYFNINNPLIKSSDTYPKSVSVNKNKNIKHNNNKRYFNESNTFNHKLHNSINSNSEVGANIIHNTINNINNYNYYYNVQTYNHHLRSNNPFDFNNKYHSLENSLNNFYVLNSSSENQNIKYKKDYHVTDLNDYLDRDFNNIDVIKKNNNSYIYIKEPNFKTENNTEIKEENFKKINILNGSAIIQRKENDGNLKDNNTIYISNLNKKIELGEHNKNKQKQNEKPQIKVFNLGYMPNKINNDIGIFKIQNNKSKNGKKIGLKKNNNNNQSLSNNFFKNGYFNINPNVMQENNNNIKEHHKKKNIPKKNVIPINDKKIDKIYYKNPKKHTILRKKINLNISKKNNNNIKSPREIIHTNKIPIQKTSIFNYQRLSFKKNLSEKKSKKNIIAPSSNNFVVTINATKNNENKNEINFTQDGKKAKRECELCHIFVEAYLYRTHHMNHPTQILKFLYLGNYKHSSDNKELKKLKINYILNCAIECHNYNLPKKVKELHLKVKDIDTFEILYYFDIANEFINKCKLMGGICLVHCKLGVSRSTTFVIAYLMKYANLTTDEAFEFVKNKRSSIKPNDGFMRQLRMYEQILRESQ